jgi:CheY-like chemotaxis protein
MLQLEIEDTGPGISKDQSDRIFEAFVQLESSRVGEGGTGLGLAISKTLVEMMRGDIQVKSEPGQGSTFMVNIPLSPAEEVVEETEEVYAVEVIGLAPGHPEWRILVVDDNLENRLLITDMLTRVGFAVQEAPDGEVAIDIFQQWQPHFIWMDMRMPVMDGFAATRKIRELPGGIDVKIVAVTASVLAEESEPILAAGCDDIVRKPFREHQIFEAMARFLDVDYRYNQSVESTGLGLNRQLAADILSELPRGLLKELRTTIVEFDREGALQVIERIHSHAPETAQALRSMVEGFKIGQLGELLKDVK